MSEVLEMGAERVLLCAPGGPLISGDADAADLVGEAFSAGAGLIAVPVERLDPAFFRLASGLAGAVAQKVVNYHKRLAVVGDIETHLANSEPLRAWVGECNRQGQVVFVPTLEALSTRLAGGR
jgi:hypothetical protein